MKRYLPQRYEADSLFDALNDFFKPVFFDETSEMRTDIKETENGYQLDIEMPGFKKNELGVSLENGYLTVTGNKHVEEKTDKPKYLKKERSESFRRSYYVGDDIAEEDVKAKYEDGILCLTMPKSKPKQIQSHSINID